MFILGSNEAQASSEGSPGQDASNSEADSNTEIAQETPLGALSKLPHQTIEGKLKLRSLFVS